MVLLSNFFPFENDEGDQMCNQVYFVEGLAGGEKLDDAFVITGVAWVQIVTFLILQGIFYCLFYKLLSDYGHLSQKQNIQQSYLDIKQRVLDLRSLKFQIIQNQMQIQDLYTGGYLTKSKVNLKLASVTQYRKLLIEFDPSLKQAIENHNPQFMNLAVFLIEVKMTPEKLNWLIWKNTDQLLEFIVQIQDEIDEMVHDDAKKNKNVPRIMQLFGTLKMKLNFDQESINQFMQFINLLADQPYMRKTQEFLLFLEHCMSIDKWNIKVYQQLAVDKAPTIGNKVKNFFSCGGQQNRSTADRQNIERDYFITITSDGILKSDNHLMESRISSMIPFTSQLKSSPSITPRPQSYLSFNVNSNRHENIDVHFYKDYTKGINFALGLKMALRQSSYTQPHRFESYAPKRSNCASRLYNDGAGYFSDLYDELIRAQNQVCITGWMITPYFLLKRPNKIADKKYRLDGVLEEIATRGVKIFIIAFKEPKLFVNNDSEHVQYYLESLHPNIRVVRHPDPLIPSIWSHHQKMVIIDQKIGFMGGLDIAYGRWDTPQHLLVDPGQLWDGQDYNNYRTRDVYEPRNFEQSNLNPSFEPRMPWHDIALQFRGDVVLDLLRHFIQYWYFVQADKEFHVTDIAQHFSSKESKKTKNPTHQMEMQNARREMQKDEKSIRERLEKKKQDLAHKTEKTLQKRQDTIPEVFIHTRSGSIVGKQNLQMCRSASPWSIGTPEDSHEQSIHNAYQKLIEESENFIYLENQFFMGLQNKIVDCLVRRIQRAFLRKERFRVIIVLPLLPGFEGDISNPLSSVLRIQVHHQYNAIIKGQKSLYTRLVDWIGIKNIQEYLFIYGLRTSALLDDVPITQIIYVHSKLMIVDDKRCIIGSANINDRSLLGSRDSELACIIEENQGNIFDLRARIYNQHFNLTRQQSTQVMNDQQIWYRTIENAKRNTMIYRKVFGCIPDDTVTVVGEISRLAVEAKMMQYKKLRNQIVGHAVQYPLQFLKDEDLTFKPNQKQFFAPEGSFT